MGEVGGLSGSAVQELADKVVIALRDTCEYEMQEDFLGLLILHMGLGLEELSSTAKEIVYSLLTRAGLDESEEDPLELLGQYFEHNPLPYRLASRLWELIAPGQEADPRAWRSFEGGEGMASSHPPNQSSVQGGPMARFELSHVSSQIDRSPHDG